MRQMLLVVGITLGLSTVAFAQIDIDRELPPTHLSTAFEESLNGMQRAIETVANRQVSGAGQPGAPVMGGDEEDDGRPDPGTDPSKVKRRFMLYHEYYNIQGNNFNFNTTTAQVIFPILGGGGTLWFSVPFTYAELPRANLFGLGDAWGRFILLPTKWEAFQANVDWPYKSVTPFFGTDIYIPTADSTLVLNPLASRIVTVSLGTQKYRLAPLVGFAWQVSEHWSIIPVYFQEMSIAGNQQAASINQGKLRLFVQYRDPSGWYFKPEFQVVTDYNDDNRTEFYVAPEVGKVFKGGTTFYVKPGYGLIREDLNRNWGIELGIRTQF